MKSMFSSPEAFEAYATISAGNYVIQGLIERLGKPKSGIDKAIDSATGKDKSDFESAVSEGIAALEDIIKAKQFIEEDYSRDVELLNKIKAMGTEA